MGHDSLLLSQGRPELCSDTDGASGQLESQLWCLSGQAWARALRIWSSPLQVCLRAAAERCWTRAFSAMKKSSGYPWRTTLKSDFWCPSVQLQTSVNHMEGTHSLLHNTFFSTSLRKISLKHWGALLLGAAVHSSLLAGLFSVITQWGNPFCQRSEPGRRRRKHSRKRKDVYEMSHQLFSHGMSSALRVIDWILGKGNEILWRDGKVRNPCACAWFRLHLPELTNNKNKQEKENKESLKSECNFQCTKWISELNGLKEEEEM